MIYFLHLPVLEHFSFMAMSSHLEASEVGACRLWNAWKFQGGTVWPVDIVTRNEPPHGLAHFSPTELRGPQNFSSPLAMQR